ncbi:MAG TPA: penicillin-binding transpeptidase domain-containing protein [Dehalococcoidia bacterium]|nr:penicillin-binding transpeptidase domain-containing protein [Dehalococcoidia bacterium]
MIRQIRQTAAVFAVGFFLLSGGLVYWQVVRANTIARDPGNPRTAEAARTADRGRMLDRNGSVLVQSVLQADGSRLRRYALPSLAQTTGYVSTRFGLSGLEQAYNQYLSGNSGGDPLDTAIDDLLHRSRPGNDLVLTIDARLQAAAAQALGDRPGAVVALDPSTGAVLAMVSAPAYDPGAIDAQGDRLLNDAGKPLLNRATQGLYPPGSTYKVVTATAALDSGKVKPGDRYRCVNGVVVQGFVINCENAPPGRTEWDFETAFAFSINATFAQVAADQLGSDLFLRYSRAFGMDQALPFDIDTAESRTSHAGGGLDPVLLANSGFGQGQLQVTPLQMALIAATVANHGSLPRPYLVQQVRAPDGSVIQDRAPQSIRRVMSEQTAQQLTQFMLAAVQEFGGAAGLLNQEIAGKTGTAETGAAGAADSWFIGFAPSAHPRLAVAVIVENGGPGSQAAAPIAGQVFRAFAGR